MGAAYVLRGGQEMKIRIKFRKQGPVRFIGHLDVMRYFQKVMRRAEIDIRYSEGFSPHQIMSFASPLSVGLTSNGEYMDIEVNSAGTSAEMVKRLNAVNVEGIEVVSCRLLPDSAKNAMSQVAAADYRIWIKEEYGSGTDPHFMDRFLAFCGRESIEITKITKKEERTVDLGPFIYETGMPAENTVFLKLSAGSAVNVKPEQLLAAFCDSEGTAYQPYIFQVEREEVYADEDPEGGHRFVSLEDYGEEMTD